MVRVGVNNNHRSQVKLDSWSSKTTITLVVRQAKAVQGNQNSLPEAVIIGLCRRCRRCRRCKGKRIFCPMWWMIRWVCWRGCRIWSSMGLITRCTLCWREMIWRSLCRSHLLKFYVWELRNRSMQKD